MARAGSFHKLQEALVSAKGEQDRYSREEADSVEKIKASEQFGVPPSLSRSLIQDNNLYLV